MMFSIQLCVELNTGNGWLCLGATCDEYLVAVLAVMTRFHFPKVRLEIGRTDFACWEPKFLTTLSVKCNRFYISIAYLDFKLLPLRKAIDLFIVKELFSKKGRYFLHYVFIRLHYEQFISRLISLVYSSKSVTVSLS